MKIHTETGFSIYTGGAEGGCVDIAHIELQGFTLVANADLARLRQVAACMDPDPLPSNVTDVLGLCLKALVGPAGGLRYKTQKAKDAVDAIRDLLKAAPSTKKE